MTEPVARAVSPRRTVRVAVALVVGQAALCAVIGWVTFGPSEAKPQAAGDQPQAGQVVLPRPSNIAPPIGPAPVPPGPSAAKSSSRVSRPSTPTATNATSRTAAEKPRPVMATEEKTSDPAPPNPELAASPSPSSTDEVQSPVTEGQPCGPEGARGETPEKVELRCVKEADGDLVWQIN